MHTSSSMFIGQYFLFLLSAKETCPLKIQFKDRDVMHAGKRPSPRSGSILKSPAGVDPPWKSPLWKSSPWKEKIYLYPAVLARKWTEYRYRERFIPAARYDNVQPVHATCHFANRVNRETEVTLSSADKEYRNLEFLLLDCDGVAVCRTMMPRLSRGKPQRVCCRVSRPGLYRMALKDGETIFFKSHLLFYRKMLQRKEIEHPGPESPELFCCRCRTGVHLLVPEPACTYLHKNYIPIKDYLDTGGLDYACIVRFITGMDHPPRYRDGLVHLLNMIRLASLSDEMTIMTNLYRDDPAFAHYITDRLFLFRMIPIMEDRELQRIFNTLDDTVLSGALKNESPQLVNKVLHNVSRRRAQVIRSEPGVKISPGVSERAKREVHRSIRLHFEQRFGRELRIPSRERLVYRPPSPGQTGERAATVLRHTGELLSFDGTDARPLSEQEPHRISSRGDLGCLAHDREALGSEVFVPAGVTESTIFLACTTGIRYARVHQYDWNSSLEDCEMLENLPRWGTIALKRMSHSVVLTVGAIDGRGIPHEQVLRVSTGAWEKQQPKHHGRPS